MKPPPFDYVRPASIDEAIAFVGDTDRFAKVIAGGQSLVPMTTFDASPACRESGSQKSGSSSGR